MEQSKRYYGREFTFPTSLAALRKDSDCVSIQSARTVEYDGEHIRFKLLLQDGSKIEFDLDDSTINEQIRVPKEGKKIPIQLNISNTKVGHLRKYLFKNWTTVIKNRDQIFSPQMSGIDPVIEEQIQFIHSGVRINPNKLLSNVNFRLCQYLIMFVKPLDLFSPYESVRSKKADKKVKRGFRLSLSKIFRKKEAERPEFGAWINNPVSKFIETPNSNYIIDEEEGELEVPLW
ncbi:hypothetical protein B5S28_g3586 [[Candida] boidinii]|uniref:Unnamed protein product n=1 Tax=Candida boidinii TaxID=5477 RepID=A0ACB5U312_CANBO|nr:hypothetical protein B5S28_g3586 [[Candida] boidinii]OWB62239.1 hypothetical protein B5S29_g3161 [[Candida] boidinii]OWB78487.1 hypothetical protein B5S32_g2683 [[Candida] boidinii]GMF00531.1 unnamed protein product [[Candida] boidinii]